MQSNQITVLKSCGKFMGFAFSSNSSVSDIPFVIDALGIETKYIGLDRYKTTKTVKTPTNVITHKFIVKDASWYGLYFNASGIQNTGSLKQFLPQPQKYNENEMCASWGSNFFAITVHYKNKEILDTLLNAIIRGDFAIIFEQCDTFPQKGLKLIIPSLLSPSVINEIAEYHKKQHELMQMMKKTKIEKYLEKHGKEYDILIPYSFDNTFSTSRILKTRFKIVLYLEPKDKYSYNSGYFTIEELKAWGKNKGVIVR